MNLAKGQILTMCGNVCFPAQDVLGHLQKHHKYLYVGVSKLGPTRSSKNYVIENFLPVSQPAVILCCQAKLLSLGENFLCLPILIMKLKFEIIQICTIIYISVCYNYLYTILWTLNRNKQSSFKYKYNIF